MPVKTGNRKLKINKFILEAALKRQPIFKSFKKLSKFRRRINYRDFEWKYYQYYHRNTDLTIERSPLNSSPLAFSDLPIDVVAKVVEKSDLSSCLALRKVSRGLRNLVDSTEIHCEKLIFLFGENDSEISLQTWDQHPSWNTINHCQIDDGCCKVVTENMWENKKSEKFVPNSNFKRLMIDEVSTFLKNPKLKIGHISFYVTSEESISEFLDYLKTLNFLLDVRSVFISTHDGMILRILPFLKPEALEKISFCDYSLDQWGAIADTEQWKMAKTLRWDGMPGKFQMEKLLHFKKIEIDRFEFSDENLIAVRDLLLKSSHLEMCGLTTWHFEEEMEFNAESNELSVDRILGQNPAYDSGTRRFAIPASRDYFQLEFQRKDTTFTLALTRMSRTE